MIPSFAVGRTQEMLYFIRQIKADGLVYGHDGFKVYVDSPLANEATTIFSEHQYDCFDEEAMELIKKGDSETFVCSCGYKEKLEAFKNRRAKEGAGVSKRDVQKYLKKQQQQNDEPVNNAFAQALAGLKLDK